MKCGGRRASLPAMTAEGDATAVPGFGPARRVVSMRPSSLAPAPVHEESRGHAASQVNRVVLKEYPDAYPAPLFKNQLSAQVSSLR